MWQLTRDQMFSELSTIVIASACCSVEYRGGLPRAIKKDFVSGVYIADLGSVQRLQGSSYIRQLFHDDPSISLKSDVI